MSPEERIRQHAEEVLKVWGDHISTHYTGCWKRHVACFAALVRDEILDGEAEPE